MARSGVQLWSVRGRRTRLLGVDRGRGDRLLSIARPRARGRPAWRSNSLDRTADHHDRLAAVAARNCRRVCGRDAYVCAVSLCELAEVVSAQGARLAMLTKYVPGTEVQLIRKLKSGEYRIYSIKVDPRTGKRRNLGTFNSLAAARKHEREIQYFKRR